MNFNKVISLDNNELVIVDTESPIKKGDWMIYEGNLSIEKSKDDIDYNQEYGWYKILSSNFELKQR